MISSSINKNPQYAFAIDIDQNGKEDLIYQTLLPNGSYWFQTVYNNIAQDQFYLSCELKTTTKVIEWMANPGVIYRAVVTDLDNKKYLLVRSQL